MIEESGVITCVSTIAAECVEKARSVCIATFNERVTCLAQAYAEKRVLDQADYTDVMQCIHEQVNRVI